MTKVKCLTVAFVAAIAMTSPVSAEKLWGHDVWIAQCVPARGDSYWIAVSSDGFVTMSMDRTKILARYPNLEEVSVNNTVLHIIASNSTERVAADFDIRSSTLWRLYQKDDVNSRPRSLLSSGGGVECSAAVSRDIN
jgi:hypothetical protein